MNSWSVSFKVGKVPNRANGQKLYKSIKSSELARWSCSAMLIPVTRCLAMLSPVASRSIALFPRGVRNEDKSSNWLTSLIKNEGRRFIPEILVLVLYSCSKNDIGSACLAILSPVARSIVLPPRSEERISEQRWINIVDQRISFWCNSIPIAFFHAERAAHTPSWLMYTPS